LLLSYPVFGGISVVFNPVIGVFFTCKSVSSVILCAVSNPVSGAMLSDPVSGVISVRCLILSLQRSGSAQIKPWLYLRAA
jgi:hypothetical protein